MESLVSFGFEFCRLPFSLKHRREIFGFSLITEVYGHYYFSKTCEDYFRLKLIAETYSGTTAEFFH